MEHLIPVLPVGNKIIVHPLPKKEQQLASGIVVATSVNAELLEGEVVAVSPQVAKDSEGNNLYKIGDIVLYNARKGVGQFFNGQAYLWLDTQPHLEEIWGIKQ